MCHLCEFITACSRKAMSVMLQLNWVIKIVTKTKLTSCNTWHMSHARCEFLIKAPILSLQLLSRFTALSFYLQRHNQEQNFAIPPPRSADSQDSQSAFSQVVI